ncbi:MAG: hypothetical protein VKL60_18040 [Sphaerospermopsis sp.]|uniref:Uncharacterized protein n=1 Tax=Anabaena sphaerica FACHB-251 TaxID=2692883 RepID=A0A926WNS4_9NOST|nr:hypothetical protein [Anabaena sphaerica]MBD2296861.1 hypothetical protein [Anabaena sphaerica FACHB-251]MEB3150904.1 hypothetical protein [Sphaerospermopsis sp.]
MEQSRTIYETLINQRCSDSHWSKIKKLANTADIPLDKDGLKVIINLRKLNPRYFNLYPEIKNQLTDYGETLSGELGLGVTGEKLIKLINNSLNISPDITTVYRWFYRCGTKFKKSQWYDRQTAMMVLTNALIFKAKKHRIGA